MACYHPLPAYYGAYNPKTGNCRVVVLHASEFNLAKYSMRIPCGKCIGCRLEYSRQWAIRCMHESEMYSSNCFITLTYNDDFLPKFGSLNYDHWTKFMKRLRRAFGSGIRFFMGPEYGDLSHRPHYHALLFNHEFSDTELLMVRNGNRLFTSDRLNWLWSDPVSRKPYGYASVGSVSFLSAAYVARYMLKKVKGDDHVMRYFARQNGFLDINYDTGEVTPIAPEKARMSNRPGIAKKWFDSYYSDVYPSDDIHVNGQSHRPPRYYDKLYQSFSPEDFDVIKQMRVDNSVIFKDNNTTERLLVREKVKISQLKSLVRDLE